MSHIAFDLDALPLVPKVARSAGIGEAVVGWGLTQMWEWCWREKTDRVTTNHLRGFFGTELGAILVDFGFLETVGHSIWRVKGAARYLRIQAAREAGGKKAAAAGNLKRGKAKPAGGGAGGSAGASLQLPSSTSPAPLQLPPSPTATSDERLATSDERQDPSPAKKPREPDPRFGPMVGRIKATYRGLVGSDYEFSDNDGAALKSLLKAAEDDEIDRRFRVGLLADQYSPKCATVFQLRTRWNELAVSRTATKPRDEHEYTESRRT